MERLSNEYIRGLIEGEGTFTFSSNGRGKKIPAFAIKMHIRDKQLLELVVNSMGLRNRVYSYNYQYKDSALRGPHAMLIVREFGQLKNIIVPFCYKKLRGNKGIQFMAWMEKIGTDPEVSKNFKFIHQIYKAGFYDKNPQFD